MALFSSKNSVIRSFTLMKLIFVLIFVHGVMNRVPSPQVKGLMEGGAHSFGQKVQMLRIRWGGTLQGKLVRKQGSEAWKGEGRAEWGCCGRSPVPPDPRAIEGAPGHGQNCRVIPLTLMHKILLLIPFYPSVIAFGPPNLEGCPSFLNKSIWETHFWEPRCLNFWHFGPGCDMKELLAAPVLQVWHSGS